MTRSGSFHLNFVPSFSPFEIPSAPSTSIQSCHDNGKKPNHHSASQSVVHRSSFFSFSWPFSFTSHPYLSFYIIPQHKDEISRNCCFDLPQFSTTMTSSPSISDIYPLSTNINLHAIYRAPTPYLSSSISIENQKQLPPLVFIHGSFHSAWCWDEHFLHYFASKGFHAFAVSLRGTGPSMPTEDNSKNKTVKVEQHVQDIDAFVRQVVCKLYSSNSPSPSTAAPPRPVFIAHSFGGATLLKLLEFKWKAGILPSDFASAFVLMCSVPPSGNTPMVKRFLFQRGLGVTWDITRGFVLKKATSDPDLVRKLFFDEQTSQDLVLRSMQQFKKDSVYVLDVTNFNKNLPSLCVDKDTHRAQWINDQHQARGEDSLPILVIGAQSDFLVDHIGVEETARFLGVPLPTDKNIQDTKKRRLVLIHDAVHDLMLIDSWKVSAQIILDWLHISV